MMTPEQCLKVLEQDFQTAATDERVNALAWALPILRMVAAAPPVASAPPAKSPVAWAVEALRNVEMKLAALREAADGMTENGKTPAARAAGVHRAMAFRDAIALMEAQGIAGD